MISDSVDVDRSLGLKTFAGELLNVRLKEVSLDRLNKYIKSCNILFSIPASVYKDLEAKKLFRLDGETGTAFIPEGLEDDKEVEIEAGLKRELVSQLLRVASEYIPEENLTIAPLVARYLLQLGSDLAETPFLKVENWYALYVQQEISTLEEIEISEGMEIPEGMEVEKFKLGAKTAWGYRFDEAEYQEDVEEEGAGEIFSVMLEFCEAQELEYEADGELGAIAVSISGKPGTWNCFCEAIDGDRRFCRIYSVLPFEAKPERYAVMSELLGRINAKVSIGNFEMSYETGEIRFRTSIDLEGDRFSEALMKQLFVSNVFTMERYFNTILMVLMDEATPEEALMNNIEGY